MHVSEPFFCQQEITSWLKWSLLIAMTVFSLSAFFHNKIIAVPFLSQVFYNTQLCFVHGRFLLRETLIRSICVWARNLHTSYCLTFTGLAAFSPSITTPFLASFQGFRKYNQNLSLMQAFLLLKWIAIRSGQDRITNSVHITLSERLNQGEWSWRGRKNALRESETCAQCSSQSIKEIVNLGHLGVKEIFVSEILEKWGRTAFTWLVENVRWTTFWKNTLTSWFPVRVLMGDSRRYRPKGVRAHGVKCRTLYSCDVSYDPHDC